MVEDGARRAPILVIDGSETIEGRAMAVLSALHHCRDWIGNVQLKMIDLTDEDVTLACDVLRWEDGLEIETHPPLRSSEVLENADLYVAIAFRTCQHLRLEQASQCGIPALLAVQFPDPAWTTPSTVLRHRAAFDPREFATVLRQVVGPWL